MNTPAQLEPVFYGGHPKNPHHGDAIRAGWKARVVHSERQRLERGNVLHLLAGLQWGVLELTQAVRRIGLPYVFFDRAYFGGGPKTNVLRATRDAYQQHWVRERSPDRAHVLLKSLGLTVKPWRKSGGHILLVPPSSAPLAALYGLESWEQKMLVRLTKITDRPVVVSYKGDPKPLAERLENCHCVVQWTSNLAVEAVLEGVPCFVAPESAARPVCAGVDELESWIHNPPMPDRDAWIASLAWGQFTLDELRSGFARNVLEGEA